MSYTTELAELKVRYQRNERTIASSEAQLGSILNRMEEDLGVEIDDPSKFDFEAAQVEVEKAKSDVELKIRTLLAEAEEILGTQ